MKLFCMILFWMICLIFFNFELLAKDFQIIDDFEKQLPDYSLFQEEDMSEILFDRDVEYIPLLVDLPNIAASGVEIIAIREGQSLIQVRDGKSFKLLRPAYLKSYRMMDTYGFKYILDKNDEILFKIHHQRVESIQAMTELTRPPLKYSEDKIILEDRVLDKKLDWHNEFLFGLDYLIGDFNADLFNKSSTRPGGTLRLGWHFMLDWNTDLKIGLALQGQSQALNIPGAKAHAQAFSGGIILRSRDYFILDSFFRFMGQFRMDAYSKLDIRINDQEERIHFNGQSALISIEFPFDSKRRDLFFAPFYEYNWKQLKRQQYSFDLKSSTRTNKNIGFLMIWLI